ncbi:hypothetical protein IV203_014010 [Nitzschia inconspicua]|uniref:Uncharacterized protein n=1 Tax=Nitzschia inconspicua TaxID=303405 RepID=A0A9K3M711_9STRA|nr:hypothetical protein IV203_014208 [Nitzschia inconspicua]KAG7374915.1 hypothetical protein IV203_014010 [Nitzschia inconspicua]
MISTSLFETSNYTSSKKKDMGSSMLSRMMDGLYNRRKKLDLDHHCVIEAAGDCKIAADTKKDSLDGDTAHTTDTFLSLDELGSDVGLTTTPKKRSVRFSPYTTVRRTLSRYSFTKEEMRNCWYQKEEYDHILSSCHRLVTKYEQHMQEKTPFKYCMRGLEHQTAVRGCVRANNRFSALEVVFAAQYENPKDEDAIADCYSSISSICHHWAHYVGLKDQKVAQRYYCLKETQHSQL